MKTVFVTIYDGDTEKIYLRSGAVARLTEAGVRVVLLIRAADRVPYYRQHFEGERLTVEPLPPALNRSEELWYHLSWNTIPTYSVRVKRHDLYLEHGNRMRYALEWTAGFLGRFRPWRQFLRQVYLRLPDRYAEALFATYRPDLLFCPNMFSAEDCRLLRAARRRCIPTVTTIKSWDVATTRGFTRVIADRLLVFNEINREEAIAIGDYPPERIRIVGFPQFDIYTRREHLLPREAFFRQIGGDPARKLILYAVPGDFKNPYSHEILTALDQAIEEGRVRHPVQVLARFHPKYPSKAERLQRLKHFILDRPGTYFQAERLERGIDAPAAMAYQWTFTDHDLAHLANSLYHSDVTINTESTMSLDAAAFDRPVISIGFDGFHRLDYWRSLARNYRREHYRSVLETGGVRLAQSFDELIEYINMYLDDPTVDREGRARLRERVLFRLDGRSAQRVAGAIHEML